MRVLDRGRMAFDAIVRYPLRSGMLLVAISIGVAAVLVLTSLGEGARRYIHQEFLSLGADLLIVVPGKMDVAGGEFKGTIGMAPRPLTLQDVVAIEASPYVQHVMPFIGGRVLLNFEGRERSANVVGTNAFMKEKFSYEMQNGRFLPNIAIDKVMQVAVIGDTLSRELFGSTNPVGKWVRIGERRVRIIGRVQQSGQTGSVDVDESVFVPVAFAAQMFNADSIQRMMVEPRSGEIDTAGKDIIEIVKARHQGVEDITVIDPGSMMKTFNSILMVLTSMLAGIASISLLVAGTLIMNVMLVAVSQRTQEVGLIKALGGRRQQIISLFLTEAAVLSFFGALLGLLLGQGSIALMRELYPIVDFQAPLWATIAAVVIAVLSGLIFGIIPARRAANLDPVEALTGH